MAGGYVISNFSKFFQNMFSMSHPLSKEDNEKCDLFLRSIAKEIVLRRMSGIAIMFLEMYKPVTLIGHQAFLVLEPTLQVFIPKEKYSTLMKILEDRGRIEQFIQIIEDTEKEYRDSEKQRSN